MCVCEISLTEPRHLPHLCASLTSRRPCHRGHSQRVARHPDAHFAAIHVCEAHGRVEHTLPVRAEIATFRRALLAGPAALVCHGKRFTCGCPATASYPYREGPADGVASAQPFEGKGGLQSWGDFIFILRRSARASFFPPPQFLPLSIVITLCVFSSINQRAFASHLFEIPRNCLNHISQDVS